jgi:hypothetical protein
MALVQPTTSTKTPSDLVGKKPSVTSGVDASDFWLWTTFGIAALVVILYVRAFAVNVVLLDEWAFIPYLKTFNAGLLDYGKFFLWRYNEHKIFFPLILLYWIASLTHYDAKAVQYVGPVIMILTTLIVLLMARKRMRAMPFGGVILSIIACFLLDLQQWQNMIFGYSACIVGVSLLFVLCVYLLERVRKLDWRLLLAAVSGFCATFSYANGFLCWPIGLGVLWLSRRLLSVEFRKNLLVPMWIWTAVGIATIALYYSDGYFIRKGFVGNIGPQLILGQPSSAAQLILTAIAIPLAGDPHTAIAIGLAIACILVFLTVVVLRGKWLLNHDSTAPLALLLFGLASAGMIFVGRAGAGFSALLVSRYTSITNLEVVGLAMFVASLRTVNSYQRMSIVACLAYAMFVITVSSAVVANDVGQANRNHRLEAARILRNYKTLPDKELEVLCPFPVAVRLYAPYLEQQKYSVFRH